jgi:hypothetical protein
MILANKGFEPAEHSLEIIKKSCLFVGEDIRSLLNDESGAQE